MASRPEHQSLRSSCDRCRAKKLGCTISAADTARTGVQQCTRCVRAKVNCVFSRRASMTRRMIATATTTAEKEPAPSPSIIPVEPTVETNNPAPTAMHVGLASSQSHSLPNVYNDPLLWSFNTNNSINNNNSIWPDDAGEDICPPPLDNACILDCSQDNPHDMADLFSNNMFPSFPNQLDTPLSSCGPTTSASISFRTTQNSAESNPDKTVDTSMKNPLQPKTSIIQLLSSLVAEIHEVLALVNSDFGPERLESARDVDAYPVSQVLTLTRKFTTLLRGFWSPDPSASAMTHCLQEDEAEYLPSAPTDLHHSLATPMIGQANKISSNIGPITTKGRHQNSTSPTTWTDVADVPTMLLVLTCYASLARLYRTMFSHIQRGLRQTLSPPKRRDTRHTSSEPQLDDLFSGSNETWTKMYMAVQMFLDEFQSLESIVSPPHGSEDGNTASSNQVLHSLWFSQQLEMVRSVLDDEGKKIPGTTQDRDVSGLLRQGTWLKAVLRERMGF